MNSLSLILIMFMPVMFFVFTAFALAAANTIVQSINGSRVWPSNFGAAVAK